jgi:hypothetical protein
VLEARSAPLRVNSAFTPWRRAVLEAGGWKDITVASNPATNQAWCAVRAQEKKGKAAGTAAPSDPPGSLIPQVDG